MMHDAGAFAPSFPVASRLDAFVAEHSFDQPTLVIDLDRVETQYRALKKESSHALSSIHHCWKQPCYCSNRFVFAADHSNILVCPDQPIGSMVGKFWDLAA